MSQTSLQIKSEQSLLFENIQNQSIDPEVIRKSFRELTNIAGDASATLPALKIEKSPFEMWWNQLIDWIQGFFPKMKIGKISLNLEPIEFVIAAIFILIIVALAYFFGAYFYHKAKLALEHTLRTPLPQNQSLKNSLVNELNQYLDQKNYSKAARMRWKIFLFQHKQNQAITPREWARSQKLSPSIFNLGYRLMFDDLKTIPQVEKEFMSWDQLLSSMISPERGRNS